MPATRRVSQMEKATSFHSSKIVDQSSFDLWGDVENDFFNQLASSKNRDHPASDRALPILAPQKKRLSAQEDAAVSDIWISSGSYKARPSTQGKLKAQRSPGANGPRPPTKGSSRSPASVTSSIREYISNSMKGDKEGNTVKYSSWTQGVGERSTSSRRVKTAEQTKSLPSRSVASTNPPSSEGSPVSSAHLSFRDKFYDRVRNSSSLASVGSGNDRPAHSPPVGPRSPHGGRLLSGSRRWSRNSTDSAGKNRSSSNEKVPSNASLEEHTGGKGAAMTKISALGSVQKPSPSDEVTDLTHKLAEWSGCAKKPVDVLNAELQILFSLAKTAGSVVVTQPPP